MFDKRAFEQFARDLLEIESDQRGVILYHDDPPKYDECWCNVSWTERTEREKRAVRLMGTFGYSFQAYDQLVGRCNGCEGFKCYQKL